MNVKKHCHTLSSSDPEWASSLLEDVAFVILDKLLEPIDHIQFAAVCKHWHSYATHYNQTKRRWPKLLSPLLIIPGDNRDLIYSLSEAKVSQKYNIIHLPAMPLYHRYHPCGRGWMAKMKHVYESTRTQLLNPFTGATHKLICRGWRFGESNMPKHPNRKKVPNLILLSDPSLNGDNSFMAVAFYTTGSSLGFTRGGQSRWSSIETVDQYAITDAIFYKGQVYAVDKNFGRIVSFDVKRCTSGNKLKANILNTTNMRSSAQSYLVESTKGELLHIRRFLRDFLKFEVYKLVFDDDGAVVQQVQLKSLGDQTLFVGDNQSMSVLASSFSWCQPNSIYYTSDSIIVEDDKLNRRCICDIGIFNLEEETTTPLQCYPQHCSPEYYFEPATWMFPTSLFVFRYD